MLLCGNALAKNSIIQTININATKIVIEQGDITQSQTQAIVNAANEQLAGGAGVCGAIFKAAGWQQLQAACDTYIRKGTIRCPVGTSCITKSFALQARGIDYIIHAVGPDCRIIKNEQEQNALLKGAYQHSLVLAEKTNIKSIAFPFISSAIYAFPKERAASIALNTVINHAQQSNTSLEAIHIVLFSQDDVDLFCKTLQELYKN